MFSGIAQRCACMAAAAFAMGILAPKPVRAGLTSVGNRNSFDTTQDAILSQVYGGTFVAGRATACDGQGVAQLSSARGEELPVGMRDSIRCVVSIWGDLQTFGCLEPSGAPDVFTANGLGFDFSGSSALVDSNGSTRASAGSAAPDNSPDGHDQSRSYKITGLNNGSYTWALLSEDLNNSPTLARGRTAGDFNDLAVDVQAIGSTTFVPLPGAAWTGLSTLAGIAAVAIARKRMHRAH